MTHLILLSETGRDVMVRSHQHRMEQLRESYEEKLREAHAHRENAQALAVRFEREKSAALDVLRRKLLQDVALVFCRAQDHKA